MIRATRKGFTLIELLVVIGIISILTGVLISSLSGGSDSARAARCLSNLKNLANACQTYGMTSSYYPLAGNMVYMTVDDSRGIKNTQKHYTEAPGWISAMTQGFYPGTSYRSGTAVSLYSTDEEAVTYALTNGVLWKYVSGNRQTYVCPEHAKKCPPTMVPRWSYLMSARFGWDSRKRAGVGASKRVAYGSLENADKVLLFSEVPFSSYNSWQPDGSGGSEDTDAILQYSSSGAANGANGADAGAGGNEQLGVNHRKGKNAYAHVVFADGHTEKLQVQVKSGKPDTTQMGQLATWLATGTDISFTDGRYQKLDN